MTRTWALQVLVRAWHVRKGARNAPETHRFRLFWSPFRQAPASDFRSLAVGVGA